MKTKITFLTIFLLSFSVMADDHMENPAFIPLEGYACNFSKGKDKDEGFWNNLIWHSLAEGMINKKIEDYGTLNISNIGLEFLKSAFNFLTL